MDDACGLICGAVGGGWSLILLYYACKAVAGGAVGRWLEGRRERKRQAAERARIDRELAEWHEKHPPAPDLTLEERVQQEIERHEKELEVLGKIKNETIRKAAITRATAKHGRILEDLLNR